MSKKHRGQHKNCKHCDDAMEKQVKDAMPILARITADEVAVKDAPETAPQILPGGLTLNEALAQSTFLYRAARPFSDGVVLVSDGKRFWTADAATFTPILVEMQIDTAAERSSTAWLPVIGSEAGWRI